MTSPTESGADEGGQRCAQRENPGPAGSMARCIEVDEATTAFPHDLLGRNGGGRNAGYEAGDALQGTPPGDCPQVLQCQGCPPPVRRVLRFMRRPGTQDPERGAPLRARPNRA